MAERFASATESKMYWPLFHSVCVIYTSGEVNIHQFHRHWGKYLLIIICFMYCYYITNFSSPNNNVVVFTFCNKLNKPILSLFQYNICIFINATVFFLLFCFIVFLSLISGINKWKVSLEEKLQGQLQISALLKEPDVNTLHQGKTINKIQNYRTWTTSTTVRFLKYICFVWIKKITLVLLAKANRLLSTHAQAFPLGKDI